MGTRGARDWKLCRDKADTLFSSEIIHHFSLPVLLLVAVPGREVGEAANPDWEKGK